MRPAGIAGPSRLARTTWSPLPVDAGEQGRVDTAEVRGRVDDHGRGGKREGVKTGSLPGACATARAPGAFAERLDPTQALQSPTRAVGPRREAAREDLRASVRPHSFAAVGSVDLDEGVAVLLRSDTASPHRATLGIASVGVAHEVEQRRGCRWSTGSTRRAGAATCRVSIVTVDSGGRGGAQRRPRRIEPAAQLQHFFGGAARRIAATDWSRCASCEPVRTTRSAPPPATPAIGRRRLQPRQARLAPLATTR
jgi:hypothetical protein